MAMTRATFDQVMLEKYGTYETLYSEFTIMKLMRLEIQLEELF